MDARQGPTTASESPEERAGGPWQLGPDGLYYSPDGRYRWDGQTWRSLPRGPIGRWATAHAAAYPAVVAIVVGVGGVAIRLGITLVFGGAVPSAIVLGYGAVFPGLIGWFVARGQLKHWGAK
jgi:hypothetical protein